MMAASLAVGTRGVGKGPAGVFRRGLGVRAGGATVFPAPTSPVITPRACNSAEFHQMHDLVSRDLQSCGKSRSPATSGRWRCSTCRPTPPGAGQIGTIDGELPGPDGTPAPFDPALVAPYALGHSYAQRHADAGVPVDVLRDLMDHVAVATTMGYYNPRELHQTGAFALVA
jgi:hypothetical protein